MKDETTTRQRILDQAIELTVREGAQSVSMRKIAARVGLTPMAIYRHFKDKQELEQILLGHAFDLFEAYLQRAQEGDSARERLTTLARGFFRFALERPQHFELLFLTAGNPRQSMENSDIKEAASPTYRLLQEAVEGWMTCHDMLATDVAAVTIDILAFCVGHAALHISGNITGSDTDAQTRFERAFAACLDRYHRA